MARLSPTEIYQLAVQAGWTPQEAVNATAIALAESGGDTGVINGIGATGLWQIYNRGAMTPAFQQQMQDPLQNARAAYAKYKASLSSGCGGWWPWASYDEGPCQARNEAGRNNSWRTFLQQAVAAAAGADIASGSSSVLVPGAGSGADPYGYQTTGVVQGGASPSLPDIPLLDVAGRAVSVGRGLLWSLLFIGGALALLALGVYLIFHEQVNQAVGRAAQTAAVAA